MTPWDEGYRRMQNELPENDYERDTLVALSEAKTLNECYKRFWEPRRLSYKDLSDFLNKANVWETEHLCVQTGK